MYRGATAGELLHGLRHATAGCYDYSTWYGNYLLRIRPQYLTLLWGLPMPTLRVYQVPEGCWRGVGISRIQG